MKKIIASCSLCFFQLSHADLPLTVENLISDKGKITTEFGLTYGNNKINNTKVGGYIPVQINAIRQNQIWGVMANTRSQASNIVGRNGIREFHQGAGQRFTHYHTSNRNGAHVWYGSPR